MLNHDTAIFIKHSITAISPGTWRFTFAPEHQDCVRKLYDIYKNKTFIVFVCERDGICIVDFGILASCLDFNHMESEWIEIYRPDGGSFWIRGAKGEYERAIPLNAFPKILFE